MVVSVLATEPDVQRLKIFEQRRGIEPVGAGHLLERRLPGLGCAGLQHGLKLRARGLGAEEAAAVQGAFVTGCLAHRLEKLELVDAGEVIAGVGDVGGNVILRAGIEVGLGAGERRGDALITFAKRPPGAVVIARLDLSGKHLPPPLVDQQPEGQKGDLVESRSQEQRNVGVGGRDRGDEMQLLKVGGGDGEGDGVSDGFVKAVVGAAPEQEGQFAVSALVFVVPFLVMHRGEIVGIDVDAHLDAQVLVGVDVPRAGVAVDVAVARADELRAFVERGGQRLHAERLIKIVTIAGQCTRGLELQLVVIAVGIGNHAPERRPEILAGGRGCGGDEVVDVAPFLGPHVAEQVRGNHAVGPLRGGAVLRREPGADIGVQLAVQRLELPPGALELGGELRIGHVVPGAPQGAGVGEA